MVKAYIRGKHGVEKIIVRSGSLVLDHNKTTFFKNHPKTFKRILVENKNEDMLKIFNELSNLYRRTDPRSRKLRYGELHFGQHNFTGDGTILDNIGRKAKPVNQVDQLAKEHDLKMEHANSTLEKKNINTQTNKKLHKLNKNIDGWTALSTVIQRSSIKLTKN